MPALSAYSNYNSILLGARAAGMGGAFTALTGDPAASPFYNPAATILIEGSSLSAAMNLYNKYNTSLGEGGGDLAAAPQRLNRGYFRALPAASSSILSFGSFAFGLTFLVPDYRFYSGQVKGTADQTSFLSTVDESLWAGGTFSARLTEIDSIGFSIYYTARNFARSVNARQQTGGGTGSVVTVEEKNLTANSILPVFGYFRRLNEAWTLGLSYRPASLPISGEGTYYRAKINTTPYSASIVNRGDLRSVTKIPAKAAVGFAREDKGRNTISFDLQFYEAIAYRDLPDVPEGADQVDHRALMNFAVGYEQVVSEWMRLRLGVFSNLSSHPEPDPTKGVRQGDHVDMSGFSMNVQIITPKKTNFTVGGYYTSGSGSSTEFIGQDIAVVPETQQVFTMLVATGFAF